MISPREAWQPPSGAVIVPPLWETSPEIALLLAAGLDAVGRAAPYREADPAVVRRASHLALDLKLAPFLERYLRRHALDVPEELAAAVSIAERVESALLDGITPVLHDLNEVGIQVLLLKGADLAVTAYPADLPRVMEDVDLLVRPPDVRDAVKAFDRHGFLQGIPETRNLRIMPSTSREDQLDFRLAHDYEVPSLLKFVRVPALDELHDLTSVYGSPRQLTTVGSDVFALLEYDLHFNIAPGIEIRDLWAAPRRITLAGQEIGAQSATELFWFLATRGYHEIMHDDVSHFRHFFDVLAVVETHGSSIDWERVHTIAEKYDFGPPLFYMAWHAAEVLPEHVPTEVLESLHALAFGGGRRQDWGDFVPRLIGTTIVVPVATALRVADEVVC